MIYAVVLSLIVAVLLGTAAGSVAGRQESG